MNLSDFDYYLPKELIAQRPLEERDQSKLMVLDREQQTIEQSTPTAIHIDCPSLRQVAVRFSLECFASGFGLEVADHFGTPFRQEGQPFDIHCSIVDRGQRTKLPSRSGRGIAPPSAKR